jgi:hypothetical protein
MIGQQARLEAGCTHSFDIRQEAIAKGVEKFAREGRFAEAVTSI